MKNSRLAKFAWFVLFYNIAVVVWGVFLRASKSGDGCGMYWLTCHGEVIPSAPELKTVIEFTHRVMSGLDFLVVLGLMIAILVYFKRPKQIRYFAVISFVFIVTEALIGAGLVLTGNVAGAQTDARPIWAVGHLINTFLLLGSLSITAWLASGGNEIRFRDRRMLNIAAVVGTLAIVFVGMTGSIAALTNMLFPSASVIESFIKDFSPDSHYLVRLRILHPIGAVVVSLFLAFAAARIKAAEYATRHVQMFANILTGLIILQLIFGAVTLVTGAPIVMQLIHLLVADGVWICWVLMLAESYGSESFNT